MSGEIEPGAASTHAAGTSPAGTDLERSGGHPPHEKPEDWGWHADMGVLARGAGWASAAVLMMMIMGNQLGHQAIIWLIALTAVLVGILLYDRRRRKNAWRS